MTFVQFPGWQPGMIISEERANSSALVGRTVFSATRDTAQSIPNTASANVAAANAIQWESVTVDDLGGWSSGSPTRYTCQLAGWYELNGTVSFATNTTGSRTTGWMMNGSLVQGGHSQRLAPATTTHAHAAATLAVRLGVGDYIELVPAHNAVDGSSNPVSLNTATGGPRPTINIKFSRPA